MKEEMPKVRISFYTKYVKRLLDILLSGLAMIVLSPVYLILSIFVLIFLGWPIVYTQERPGLNEKLFKIYKFRSMTNETDEDGTLLPNSMRMTKFGKVIRRLSLDELPELWCIFTGKMSIIGPRPLMTEYLPYYSTRHHMRHAVRPGLDCPFLAPVQSLSWYDQFENDIWYIENCSLVVDLKMLFSIARDAIFGSDYRTNANRTAFDEYNPEFVPEDRLYEEKHRDRMMAIGRDG